MRGASEKRTAANEAVKIEYAAATTLPVATAKQTYLRMYESDSKPTAREKLLCKIEYKSTWNQHAARLVPAPFLLPPPPPDSRPSSH